MLISFVSDTLLGRTPNVLEDSSKNKSLQTWTGNIVCNSRQNRNGGKIRRKGKIIKKTSVTQIHYDGKYQKVRSSKDLKTLVDYILGLNQQCQILLERRIFGS